MVDLDRMAALAGIEESHWDIFGGFHETSASAKRSILSAMGFDCGSEEAISRSLERLEERPWRRLLEPVYVLRQSGGPFLVSLSLPEASWGKPLRWRLRLEDGQETAGDARFAISGLGMRRNIDGMAVARAKLCLPPDIKEGYHQLCVEGADEPSKAALIVAPPKAYTPSWLAQGKRLWGIACHLYALRSANGWGIGDFSSLANLSGAVAGFGGAAIGLNPLHALFPLQPDHASPYSPSSRMFLNFIYIDVTAVPEFQSCPEVRALVSSQGFTEQLAKARDAGFVDYQSVIKAKLAVLRLMHDFFAERHRAGGNGDPRLADFGAFVKEGGQALERFALFQALSEHFDERPFNEWPNGYQGPDTAAARDFARDNQHRLQFHVYLQWLAGRQLAACASSCADNNMAIGLYIDLAVGVDPNGADAWCNKDAFVRGARFGAPPDAFNLQGQDWGMPPFHPLKLQEDAYQPFIAMLRANMRHAGALRIDHVMGLMRLYWVPPGEKACNGAYVRYPFDDLLGILALESARNKCLVIGEDLGTVPDGFRERMAAEGALSYRVLRFERHPDGLFKLPETYPKHSLATTATHDLPTAVGFWRGNELKLRQQLNLYNSEEAREADIRSSERDRRLLIAALKHQGLLPEPFPDIGALDDEAIRQLIIAEQRYLARSAAQLLKVNLDDLLLEADQLNLPGTIDEYPNWRRRNLAAIETLANDAFVNEIIQAVKPER